MLSHQMMFSRSFAVNCQTALLWALSWSGPTGVLIKSTSQHFPTVESWEHLQEERLFLKKAKEISACESADMNSIPHDHFSDLSDFSEMLIPEILLRQTTWLSPGDAAAWCPLGVIQVLTRLLSPKTPLGPRFEVDECRHVGVLFRLVRVLLTRKTMKGMQVKASLPSRSAARWFVNKATSGGAAT
jgi:hypothetical protein